MSLRHSAGCLVRNTSISLSDTSLLLAMASCFRVAGGGAGAAVPRRCRVDGASAAGSLSLLPVRLLSSGIALTTAA